jgi:hypothetical protein
VRVDLLKLRRINLRRLRPRLEFWHHVGLDLGDARLLFRPSSTPDLRRSRLTGGGLPGSTGRGLGSELTTANFGHYLTGGAIRRGGPLQQHRVCHPAVKKNLLELAARRQAPRQLGVPVRGGQDAARRAGGFGKLAGGTSRDGLWAAATELKTSTLFGGFGIDPESGAQMEHQTVLVRWTDGRPTPVDQSAEATN